MALSEIDDVNEILTEGVNPYFSQTVQISWKNIKSINPSRVFLFSLGEAFFFVGGGGLGEPWDLKNYKCQELEILTKGSIE